MKTLYFLIGLLSFSPMLGIGQCSFCTAFNVPKEGQTVYALWSDWKYGEINGNYGEDYISFQADAGKSYVITTLSQFGGNVTGVSAKDVYLTIIDPNQPNGFCYLPAPGVFGESYDDDYLYGDSPREPFMIWSPSQSGTYYLYVTAYPCVELGANQHVTLAYREVPFGTTNFAVWTGACDDDWANDCNWVSRGTTGAPSVGRPTSFFNYDVNLLGNRNAALSGNVDTCKHFYLEGQASFEVDAGAISIQNLINQGNQAIDWVTWTTYTDYAEIFSQSSTPGTLIFSQNQLGANNLQGVKVKFNNPSLPYAGLVSQGNSTLHSLEVNLPGGLAIPEDLSITHNLTFTDGTVSTAKTLALGPQVQITNPGLSRYIVEGSQVEKTTNGNGTFIIPFGSNGNFYRQIDVTPNTSQQTKWNITFSHTQSLGGAVSSGLDHVSTADLWTAERIAGPTVLTGTVKLHWGDCSGVDNTSNGSDLRVAGWNAQLAKWVSLGNTSVTMNGNSGEILSGTVDFATYKHFTLASTSSSHRLKDCNAPRLTSENLSSFDFKLFPNPSHDQVNISWVESDIEGVLKVIDLSGRVVLRKQVAAGINEQAFSIAFLANGIYQVVLDLVEQQAVKRLVKY